MLAHRFSQEKQVPGALGRITLNTGISFPTQEQMVCVSLSCDLSLLLRHQISDATDHKYSLGLQPWRWRERQAVGVIFHLSATFQRNCYSIFRHWISLLQPWAYRLMKGTAARLPQPRSGRSPLLRPSAQHPSAQRPSAQHPAILTCPLTRQPLTASTLYQALWWLTQPLPACPGVALFMLLVVLIGTLYWSPCVLPLPALEATFSSRGRPSNAMWGCSDNSGMHWEGAEWGLPSQRRWHLSWSPVGVYLEWEGCPRKRGHWRKGACMFVAARPRALDVHEGPW